MLYIATINNDPIISRRKRMTKPTKTTRPAATAKATETKAEAKADTTVPDATTARLSEGTRAARALFGALGESGRKTFDGVLAFDKALIDIVKTGVTSYIDHGKATMSAKCINDVVDLQAAYAHSAIEAGAANTRELLDLAKDRTEEAYAPVKQAIADLKDDSKAA